VSVWSTAAPLRSRCAAICLRVVGGGVLT
jgi:hypothetical protein